MDLINYLNSILSIDLVCVYCEQKRTYAHSYTYSLAVIHTLKAVHTVHHRYQQKPLESNFAPAT